MKAIIKKQGDTTIVSMDGKLDYETQEPFREQMAKFCRQNRTDSVATKIIFNLENLEFVGSSGISAFIQTLKDFNSQAQSRPRYAHVKSEFKRIIKAFDEEESFEFHDTIERAKRSFDQ